MGNDSQPAPVIEPLDPERLKPGMLLRDVDGEWGEVLVMVYGATVASRTGGVRAWVDIQGDLQCVHIRCQTRQNDDDDTASSSNRSSSNRLLMMSNPPPGW